MATFEWCRPLLRIVGLLLVGLAGPRSIEYTGQLIRTTMDLQSFGWMFGSERIGWSIICLVGAYAQLAFGLYLLFNGKAALRWVLKGVDSCCTRCGYELAGTVGDKCPECGMPRPAGTAGNSESTSTPSMIRGGGAA